MCCESKILHFESSAGNSHRSKHCQEVQSIVLAKVRGCGEAAHISLLGGVISSSPGFLSGCGWSSGCLLAPLHLLPDPLGKLILGLTLSMLRPPIRVSKAKAGCRSKSSQRAPGKKLSDHSISQFLPCLMSSGWMRQCYGVDHILSHLPVPGPFFIAVLSIICLAQAIVPIVLRLVLQLWLILPMWLLIFWHQLCPLTITLWASVSFLPAGAGSCLSIVYV